MFNLSLYIFLQQKCFTIFNLLSMIPMVLPQIETLLQKYVSLPSVVQKKFFFIIFVQLFNSRLSSPVTFSKFFLFKDSFVISNGLPLSSDSFIKHLYISIQRLYFKCDFFSFALKLSENGCMFLW